jgi:hypothetical protein
MSNLTQFAQKKLVDHTLGLANYPMPNTWLALFLSNPGESGDTSAEVTGGSYTRIAISGSPSPDFSKLTATVLATGLCTNNAAITFAAPTADWGFVTHAGVMNASTGGNMLMYFPISPSRLASNGSAAIQVPIGSFNVSGLFTLTSQMTKYLAKKWTDHILGVLSFTMPTNVYLALFGADPTEDGTLTGEIVGGSYARFQLTPAMDVTTLTTGIAQNDTEISFPDPTADYSVTHFAVLDALTSGNMLFRKARTSTLNIKSGRAPVIITAGQLAIGAD